MSTLIASPPNWITVALGEVAPLVREVVDASAIVSGTRYVGLEHISSQGEFSEAKTVDAGELASSKFVFNDRHVLYGKLRPYLLKIARPTFSGVCSTDIVPLEPGSRVDRDYLFHYLRHPQVVAFVNARTAGANLPRLSPKELATIPVPLPPLPEQRRIAAILDKADAVRRKRREAIGLTEQLLRATFLEMFGDPVTNPKGWPTQTIGQFCDRGASLVDGPFGSSLKPEHYRPSGVRVIRNWNIYDDRFDDGEFKFITTEKYAEVSRSEVKTGDVLMTTKGTVGDVCLMPELGGPSVLSASGTVRLRLPPDDMILGDFIVSQMISPSYKKYMRSFEAGSAQQYLNLSGIKKMRVVVPPKAHQERFIAHKSLVRRSAANSSQAMAMVEHLFSSLLHRAFRGELTADEAPGVPAASAQGASEPGGQGGQTSFGWAGEAEAAKGKRKSARGLECR